MKTQCSLLIAAAAVLVGSMVCFGAQRNAGDVTRDLVNPNAPQRSAQEWDAAYSAALDALMPDLGNDDGGRRAGAQSTLERIAFVASRPGAEDQRAACSKAVAAKLSDAPAIAKIWLIRQLERIGKAEAVPSLAQALNDPDANVRESARRALVKNPAKEAGEPLRKTLASAQGAWRVALINALGTRMDGADAQLLIGEVASNDDDIRIAAMRALAKIGDKSAAQTLSAAMQNGSDRARQVAADSYLLLADALAAKGDNASALEMYRGMLASPGYLKCAAVVGLGRAGGIVELPVIFAAAADADAKLRGAAVEAMAMMRGEKVTAAIAAKFASAEPPAKVAILQALQRRGDKTAAATFVKAADDADESVRIEAARGLGTLGDATSVPLLLKLAATGGNIQPVARWSIHILMGGDAVNSALLAAIDEKEPKIRAEALRALAMRHVVAAAPAMLKAAEDSDAAVRIEAIKALGVVGPAQTVAPLTALVQKTGDAATRDEAARAIASIAARDANPDTAAGPIIDAMNSSTGPAKLAIISVLGRLGGGKVLDAVRAASRDNDVAVKNAAIRALADWPDASAAADLVEIARTSSDQTAQVLALRGCVRMLREDRGMAAAQKAKLLAAALETAKRPEEKRQAIGALAEVRHLSSLEAVMSCLGDAALSQEAANAAVRIAPDIANDQPQAVKSAMQKVLETTKNADTQKQAQEALNRAEQRLKGK